HFDVILLDIGLPDGSGIDVLRRWGTGGVNEPGLILTARDSIEDCIEGVDFVADDYLTKPFITEELLARIRSLLRRRDSLKQTVFEYRGLRLDVLGRTAHLHDRALELTSREYALLEVFLRNPGRVLSRNLICEWIWESSQGTDANL